MKYRQQTRRQKILRALHAAMPYCHYCNILTILAKDMHRYSIGYENHYRMATLDHKVPQSHSGTDARDNLVLACFTCNKEKSNRHSYAEFLIMKGKKP